MRAKNEIPLPAPDTKPKRRYDIDWLRVLAVLLLFPYHTARIFDIWEPFYAKNAQTSAALTHLILTPLDAWHMPLFFLLAGASTWFTLGLRSGGQYLAERFKRLLIPLLFGVLVIIPPQTYIARLQDPGYTQSFWQFYPSYWASGFEDLSGYTGTLTPAHLWFILYLFVLSLVALPLFLYLRGEAGQRLLRHLADFFVRPGMIFLLAIPLILMLPLPAPGGKNPFFYLVFFIYGFVLMGDEHFGQVIDRHKLISLILGLALLVAMTVLLISGIEIVGGWEAILGVVYRCFVAWLLIMALLGYGRNLLSFSNRFLRYMAEGAYAFYILHQTIIVAIGHFVVQWSASIVVKFLVILPASLVATLALYDLVIRRNNITRFLFGMKSKKSALQ